MATTDLEDLAPTAGAPTTGAGILDLLLRRPGELVGCIRAERLESALLARTLIAGIAAGGAVFGAALGAWRGGLQILYSGVKLPLVLLLTAAICAPTLTALNRALGRSGALRGDVGVVLAALGRAAMVLAAETPIVLMARLEGLDQVLDESCA